MAWKCPNCETINQGQTCIVCGTPVPPDAGKKKNGGPKKIPIKIIIIIAAVALIVVGVIMAVALSQNPSEPVNVDVTDPVQTEDSSVPTDTVPVQTDPPATEPTETDPPVTDPPATEPPETEPPVTQPPETQPPETEPPKAKNEITGVSLDKTTLSIKTGDSSKLSGTIQHYGEVDLNVTWSSSNTNVAMVTAAGTVMGVSAGTATITMKASNGMTATCKVTVSAVEVTGVSLSESTFSLNPGGSAILNATILPTNATDKKLTWTSSDTKIVTVAPSGESGVKVTAVAAGSAKVTAVSANGKTAVCTVSVEEKVVEPTSVKISEASHTLTPGSSFTLSADALPENATNRALTWSSSDLTVATVTQEGTVTAKAEGRATISAQTSNGKKAQCIVTVSAVKATGLTLSGEKLTLEVGDTWTVSAEIEPADATDKKIVWVSSNEKVVTCEDGKLVAVGAGTAKVTAYLSNGIEASCTVTVKADTILPSAVYLDTDSLALDVNSVYTFTLTILPEEAKEAEITWSSSDSSVVKVDSKGSIIALKEGSAVIRAIASNNVGASCAVTVKSASSASGENDFSFSAYGGGVRIDGYLGTAEKVVIPSMIGIFPVVAIGDNAFYNKMITSVELPDNLLSIGNGAFAYCTMLSTLKLNASLESIGNMAFAGCALNSVTIPKSVTSIGYGTFAQNMMLTGITVENGNNFYSSLDGVLYDLWQSKLICVPAGLPTTLSIPLTVTEISSYAFYGCLNVTSVSLTGITTIGESAFEACSNLKTIELPSTVTEIGSGAFAYCTSLETIVLPESLTAIRSRAFMNCTSLQYITIGDSVNEIADDAFTGCLRFTVICTEMSVAHIYCLLRNIPTQQP